MKTLRRTVADLIETVSGNLVIPPYDAWRVHEWIHLRRFFRHFAVDCVFDVGANRGQYAQMIRNKVGFKGGIISFEPIPELARELREIATPDPHWHIEERALYRETGPAPFHVMADTQFSSLLRPHANQPEMFGNLNKVVDALQVERSTLALEFDRYQSQLGFKRPYLKLDTQGADLAVVEGAGETIKRFVGVQTEVSIQQIYQAGPDIAEVLSRFAALGFEPSALVPNNAGHFPRLIEVDCILFRRDRGEAV